MEDTNAKKIRCDLQLQYDSDSDYPDNPKFEKFLTTKNDEIDGLIHEVVCKLTENKDIEWNMEIIGDVRDAIEHTLIRKGLKFCSPSYTDTYENGVFNFRECYKDDCPLCNYNCPHKNDFN